ncbi:MAG: hypothetical protein CVU85_08810, partial [Firmicutes bacterium HGW-Firmicutes-10]
MKKIVLLFSMIFMLTLAACSAPVEEPGFEAEKINVYTRDTSSGTRDGFMRGIGFADASANDSLLVAGFITADNNAIMSAMATDKSGIGYVSLSSVNNTIKALDFEGVAANEANVLNNTYKLKRPFVMMRRIDGDYISDTEYQLTLAFMAYVASNDGADVIANAGATATSGTGTWASQVANFP